MNGVRYVHNTDGEYVAFVVRGNLFTPCCEWLGVVHGDHEVYDTDGAYIGELQPDDRLLRNTVSQLPRQILPPRSPMVPRRPLPPKRKLFMPAVAPPLEDVFHGLRRGLTTLTPLLRLRQLDELHGCGVVAADGAFLGRISRDPADPDSLASRTNDFGDPGAEGSIFNEAGRYGSPESELSPFHPATDRPPSIVRDDEPLAFLTSNRELADRVHPGELIAWLKLG